LAHIEDGKKWAPGSKLVEDEEEKKRLRAMTEG